MRKQLKIAFFALYKSGAESQGLYLQSKILCFYPKFSVFLKGFPNSFHIYNNTFFANTAFLSLFRTFLKSAANLYLM